MNAIFVDVALLMQRVFFGGLMLLFHGSGKMGALLSGTIPWSGPGQIGLGGAFEFVLIALAEGVASVFVILGLGTRIFAIPLVIGMLVAATVAHGDDPVRPERLSSITAYEHLNEEGKQLLQEEAEGSNRVARGLQANLEAVEEAETEDDRDEAIGRTALPMSSGFSELALLFLFGFLVIAVAGGGRFSLDRLIWPRLRALWKKEGSKENENGDDKDKNQDVAT